MFRKRCIKTKQTRKWHRFQIGSYEIMSMWIKDYFHSISLSVSRSNIFVNFRTHWFGASNALMLMRSYVKPNQCSHIRQLRLEHRNVKQDYSGVNTVLKHVIEDIRACDKNIVNMKVLPCSCRAGGPLSSTPGWTSDRVTPLPRRQEKGQGYLPLPQAGPAMGLPPPPREQTDICNNITVMISCSEAFCCVVYSRFNMLV